VNKWLLVAFFVCCTPVQAQYDMSRARANGSVAQPAAAGYTLPDIGRPYSIRVTTGATTSRGWENALTSKDPNLRHWTWIPVTSYRQKNVSVGGPGGPAVPKRPEHVYIKPNHIPLPVVVRDYHYPLAAPQSGHYTIPNKIALPVVDHGEAKVLAERRAEADVCARLQQPRRQENPRALVASTKSYSASYGDVYGSVRPNYGGGSSESLSVKAKLFGSNHGR
jgi:hypothetical protein